MIKRKLGEQWSKKAEDGKMHMYKAVEGPCERCDISHTCNLSVDCHMERGLIAKDLGILNDDGCLPSSWGEYPEIIDFGDGSYVEVHCLLRKESEIQKAEYAYGDARQEAIDNWNRRA